MSADESNPKKPVIPGPASDSEPIFTEEEKEFIERLKKQIEDAGDQSTYMIAGMGKRLP